MKMYHENIYRIIEATGKQINTIIIPKNTGLKGYAWKVLKKAGLNLEEAQKVSRTELRLGDLRLWLRRGEDIPQIVQDEKERGNAVLGVTGDDLYDEYRLRDPENTLKVENTYDWFDNDPKTGAKYFRPALFMIGKSPETEKVPLEVRVST